MDLRHSFKIHRSDLLNAWQDPVRSAVAGDHYLGGGIMVVLTVHPSIPIDFSQNYSTRQWVFRCAAFSITHAMVEFRGIQHRIRYPFSVSVERPIRSDF